MGCHGDAQGNCGFFEDKDTLVNVRWYRRALLLGALALLVSACSAEDHKTIRRTPVDGWVVFASESTRATGAVVTLDAAGRELTRDALGIQYVPMISSSPDALVLWGALSNDLGVVSKDGKVKVTHSLDRRGYTGFTALRVNDGRIVGVMNDGYGPSGLYRMVPVQQGLSGENATRGMVEL